MLRTRRKQVLTALALATLTCLVSCRTPGDGVPVGTKVGERAADFTLMDSNGDDLTLSDLRGKVVIVDFWATWCPPCRQEIPGFVALQKKYGDELVIVGVTLDDSWDPVHPFMKQYAINYPVVMGNPSVVRAFGNIDAIPTTFVLDREGVIRLKHRGYGPPDVFSKAVDEAL